VASSWPNQRLVGTGQGHDSKVDAALGELFRDGDGQRQRGIKIGAALYYPKSAGYESGRERIERSL
jgi:hypothetical protein